MMGRSSKRSIHSFLAYWPWLLSLIMIGVLCVIFHGYFHKNARAKIVEVDEANWIFYTYYYHLAFDEHDFHSSAWESTEAYGHPPVAKYLIGYALSRENLQERTMDVLRWRWQNMFYHATLPNGKEAELVSQIVPLRALIIGRRLCCVVVFLTAVLLFFTTWRAISPTAAALGALYFAMHPLTRLISTLVLGDGFLIFFIFVVVALQLLWQETKNPDLKMLLSLGLGAASALAFNTKINGILCYLATVMMMVSIGILGVLERRSRLKRTAVAAPTLIHLLVMTGSFVIACWALNPTLHFNPAGAFLTYFKERDALSDAQMRIFFNMSLPTILVRLSYAFESFVRTDPFQKAIGFSLGVPLMGIGLFGSPFYFSVKREKAMIFLLNAAVWTGPTLLYLRMAWVRYVFVLLPFASVLVAMGIETAARLIWDRPSTSNSMKAAATGSCIVFTAAVYFIITHATTARYFANHQRLLGELYSKRVALQQSYSRRTPDIPPSFLPPAGTSANR